MAQPCAEYNERTAAVAAVLQRSHDAGLGS